MDIYHNLQAQKHFNNKLLFDEQCHDRHRTSNRRPQSGFSAIFGALKRRLFISNFVLIVTVKMIYVAVLGPENIALLTRRNSLNTFSTLTDSGSNV